MRKTVVEVSWWEPPESGRRQGGDDCWRWRLEKTSIPTTSIGPVTDGGRARVSNIIMNSTYTLRKVSLRVVITCLWSQHWTTSNIGLQVARTWLTMTNYFSLDGFKLATIQDGVITRMWDCGHVHRGAQPGMLQSKRDTLVGLTFEPYLHDFVLLFISDYVLYNYVMDRYKLHFYSLCNLYCEYSIHYIVRMYVQTCFKYLANFMLKFSSFLTLFFIF